MNIIKCKTPPGLKDSKRSESAPGNYLTLNFKTMIQVFFESSAHAQEIAIFTSEQAYIAALPGLKKLAKIHGMKVTETEQQADNLKTRKENKTKKVDAYGCNLNEWIDVSFDTVGEMFSFSTLKGTVMYGKDMDTGVFFSSFTKNPYFMEFEHEENHEHETMEQAKASAETMLKRFTATHRAKQ